VTGDLNRRLMRIVAWLLTPVVAWAASFLGGWIGALVGRRAGSAAAGIKWLGGGAVLGALVGAGIWMIMLIRAGRRPSSQGDP
jgi:outer membrane lipoprotein SlyB